MFKIFEKMFKEAKDFDDAMSENKNKFDIYEGYIETGKDSLYHFHESEDIKLIPGEKIILNNNDIDFYDLPYLKFLEFKLFKVKIECKYKSKIDWFDSCYTAFGVKSIFVEKELDFYDLKKIGILGENSEYQFIENKEEYDSAKEIGYSEFITKKTKNIMKELGYGNKFTNLILSEFNESKLYKKVKMIQAMESENVPKKLIVFSVLNNSKFNVKDVLKLSGDIYE